jgi:hypothetical protein
MQLKYVILMVNSGTILSKEIKLKFSTTQFVQFDSIHS